VKQYAKSKSITLSEEEKEKARLVGNIITKWEVNHVIPQNGYGDFFDRFYEMSLTELRILSEIHS